MCRHIAYVGPALTIGRLVFEPPHGLLRQSWAPRRQRHGTVNADGFGLGWYAPGDPRPARYRRATPIWGDEGAADLARVVRTHGLLAAVRDATRPGADGEAAAAPFAADAWLFSHNGMLPGWPEGPAVELAARVLPARALWESAARTDSALVWALVLERLRAGREPGAALVETVAELARAAPGARLNLLLTDGVRIHATAWGDSLWWRAGPEPGGTVVASEPFDDEPGWREVPDRTLVTADPAGAVLTAFEESVR
ncbi:ergothioneine biosynthesis protein EgtC [Streptomyces sp. BI20]|uniref:ergothioneine biosynthesis protein EgtC n=1 Tax=Streptomyces sp. BI20 TaxID=3403460 RepID=UPI003C75978E